MSAREARQPASRLPLAALLLTLFVHVLWGANPVAVKFSVEVFPPLWTAFFRFVLGAALVYLYSVWSGVRLRPAPQEWPALIAISALFTVQIACMNFGFSMTSGSMSSVLIATNPLFAVGFMHVMRVGEGLDWQKFVGLLVAFTGVMLVLVGDAADPLVGLASGASRGAMIGNAILIASAMMLGFRLSLSGRYVRIIEPVRVAFWQMVLSLPLFGVSALFLERIRWENLSAPPLLGLAYQGFVIAGFCFLVAFSLMRRYSPGVVASFNFVSPVAGVLLSAWLLGESPGASLFAGMVLVAAGLYFVARHRTPSRESNR